jgi:hypothetical protein
MNMARLIGILFCNQGSAGWSETYPLVPTGYVAASVIMDALVEIRLAMLCEDITVMGYRISDIDVAGDAYTDNSENAGQYGTAGAPPHPVSEPANVVLRIREDTADFLHHAIRYVHGMPDQVVTGGAYSPDAEFTTAMDDYLAWLATNAMIKHRTAVGPPVTYSFLAIESAITDRIWTRNTGRPFGLHRGRRVTPAAQ